MISKAEDEPIGQDDSGKNNTSLGCNKSPKGEWSALARRSQPVVELMKELAWG